MKNKDLMPDATEELLEDEYNYQYKQIDFSNLQRFHELREIATSLSQLCGSVKLLKSYDLQSHENNGIVTLEFSLLSQLDTDSIALLVKLLQKTDRLYLYGGEKGIFVNFSVKDIRFDEEEL